MRFDLVDHQFDLPAFMIQSDEVQRRSHAWIEHSGHQPIHLAHFSQPLIGHPIGNDAHPQATLHPIVRLAWAGGGHPDQHRAIGQASLARQVLPHACFQRPQHLHPALPRVLHKPARDDPGVHQHQRVPPELVEQAVRAMYFRDIVAADLELDDGMAATLGQQHTAHLWIGPFAIVIAAARHPAASLACVSAVLKTVPSMAMSR
jgi:hypothetical protein